MPPRFSTEDARRIGTSLGIDWSAIDFGQFRRGLEVELEHGRRTPPTDVTHDDPILTAKIVLAHLHEIPEYYSRLDAMKAEAAGVNRGKTEHRLTGDPD